MKAQYRKFGCKGDEVEEIASLSWAYIESDTDEELAENRTALLSAHPPAEKIYILEAWQAKERASYSLLYEGFPRLVLKVSDIRLLISLVKLRNSVSIRYACWLGNSFSENMVRRLGQLREQITHVLFGLLISRRQYGREVWHWTVSDLQLQQVWTWHLWDYGRGFLLRLLATCADERAYRWRVGWRHRW
jgi:hypothetical protein